MERLRVFLLLVVVFATVYVASGCSFFKNGKVPAGTLVDLRIRPGYLPADPVKRSEMMEAIVKTTSERVMAMNGVVAPRVREEGTDRIVVELPGVTDSTAATSTLTRTGSLEFYYMKDLESERNRSTKWRVMLTPDADEGYVFTSVKGGKEINSKTDPELVMSQVVNAYDPVKNPKGQKPVLTGAMLLPKSTADLDSSEGPIIRISFNQTGTRTFREFSRSHKGEYLGIFYDGHLLTCPVIRDTIPNGKAQISGFKSISEANDVANYLNAGPLPVPLDVVRTAQFSEHYAY